MPQEQFEFRKAGEVKRSSEGRLRAAFGLSPLGSRALEEHAARVNQGIAALGKCRLVLRMDQGDRVQAELFPAVRV